MRSELPSVIAARGLRSVSSLARVLMACYVLFLTATAPRAFGQNAVAPQPKAREEFTPEDVKIARAYLDAEKKVRQAETRELRKKIAEMQERKKKLFASNATQPQKVAWGKDIENEVATIEARVRRLDEQVKNKLRYDKEWDYSDSLKIGRLPRSEGIWPRPWRPLQIIDEDEAVIFRPQEQTKTGEPEIRWLTGLKTDEMSTTKDLNEKQVNVWVMEDGRRKTSPDALKQIAALRVVRVNRACVDALRETARN